MKHSLTCLFPGAIEIQRRTDFPFRAFHVVVDPRYTRLQGVNQHFQLGMTDLPVHLIRPHWFALLA